MSVVTGPSLAAFMSRQYARGGPLVTWFLLQPVAGVVAYLSHRIGLRPNGLTAASLVFGIGGCSVLAGADSPAGFGLAGILLVLSYVFDCADGQLARATGQSTYRGAWLDIIADSTIVVALTLAVLTQSQQDPWHSWGFAAALLLGAGRISSLITATLSQRDNSRAEWQSKGITRMLRTAYVLMIDTPVAYFLLVVSGAVGIPLMFPAALLGIGSSVHALVIGSRIYRAQPDVDAAADAAETAAP